MFWRWNAFQDVAASRIAYERRSAGSRKNLNKFQAEIWDLFGAWDLYFKNKKSSVFILKINLWTMFK